MGVIQEQCQCACEFLADPYIKALFGTIGVALVGALGLVWHDRKRERGLVSYLNKELLRVEGERREACLALADKRHKDALAYSNALRDLTTTTRDALNRFADSEEPHVRQ